MSESLCELAEKLQHDIDWEVRRRAVIEISRSSDTQAFLLLVKALDDADDDVREAAIYALAPFRNSNTLEHLLKPKLLYDQNPNIRIAAVRTLGRFRKVGGLPVIGELLGLCKDPEWLVRNTAISVITQEIVEMGLEDESSSILPLLHILQLPDVEVHKKVVETLIEIGKHDVSILIKSLSSQSIYVKSSVARILGELRSIEAREPLIELVTDNSHMVRIEVARALGLIGGEDVIAPLVRCLEDRHPEVREKAIKSIAQQGEAIVDVLTAELRHTRNKIKRKAIIDALGLIKSERAILTLIDCLQDSYQMVRIAAINSLSGIKSPVCVSHLMDVLCVNPIDISALLDLAVSSRIMRLKIRALRALGALKDTRAIKDLEGLLNVTHDKAIRVEIEETLQKIRDAIWARRCALQVFGKLKATEALPVIISSLADIDLDVRYQALEAIENMKAQNALENVIAMASHSEAFIRCKVAKVLGTIGVGNGRVTDIIISELNDPDWEVRGQAARSLGKLNDKSAVPHLLELLKKEPFWSIRRDACFSLNNLGVCDCSAEYDIKY